ncbi:Ltp family lipoprotein [Promicromonospora sp. MS192]|uniref:Ltp family lipoprotein n=1 Tax=Promicromonospora sp. MS192 TaxID=3412684 RepID=UPI003C2DFA16
MRTTVAATLSALALTFGLAACSLPTEPVADGSPGTTEATTSAPPSQPESTEKKKSTEETNSEPKLTESQQQAIATAEDYLDYQAFSRQGLIDQLSSEYGDAFPVKDAEFAVDSLDVDWNEQAARAAQEYLDYDSFSRQGLIDQLSSKYGDQFTVEQATYGVDQTGL